MQTPTLDPGPPYCGLMTSGSDVPSPMHPSVALVEELLNAAAARAVSKPLQREGRLVVSHAVWLCACETLDESVAWLIYAVDDQDVGWRRLDAAQHAQDVVHAEHLTGDHPDPDAVLEWLRGDRPYPNGWRSPGDFIHDELLRRLQAPRP